jgi:hypothetical protein
MSAADAEALVEGAGEPDAGPAEVVLPPSGSPVPQPVKPRTTTISEAAVHTLNVMD